MRTVFWEDNQVKMIDQRVLPARLEVVSLPEYLDVARAIENMTVRGAPAIGASAAFGLALAAQRSPSSSAGDLLADLRTAAAVLKSARPTAVNLTWALDRVLRAAGYGDGSAEHMRAAVLAEAQKIA
ncbi:MAG: S-methyl-5-thioribose-1-phosphate isomerase, partial [Bacteroidota bacterium]